jgi:hypothetical protein
MVMTPERVKEICIPYGLKLMYQMGPDSYTIYYKTGNGIGYAFEVTKGTSEEELEEMAISWSLKNSFQ